MHSAGLTKRGACSSCYICYYVNPALDALPICYFVILCLLLVSEKKRHPSQYFVKSQMCGNISRKSKEAECSICNKILKSIGGSTSGLKTHAIKVHAINFEDASSGPLCKKQRTLEHLIERKSVDEVIAKLACKDGLSFQ